MDRQMYETQEKLPLLVELNILLSFTNSKKGQRQYYHLVRYESGANVGGDDEWMGKIRYLSKIIESSNKESGVTMQGKLNTVNRELLNQIGDEIEQNCVKTKAQIDKKVEKQTVDIVNQIKEILGK